MFKKIKNFFSKRSNVSEIEKEIVLTETEGSLTTESVNMTEAEKKTVLVFDQKRRVFITKTKYSIVGLFCPAKKEFYIRQSDGELETVVFNPLGDSEFAYPIAGDWTGNGYDGIGLYYPETGLALLKNEINDNNEADISIDYQVEGAYIPLSGDWQGRGMDTLGFYFKEKSVFLFPEKDAETSILRFGKKGENYLPISGDWNNNGYDTVGLYEPETSLFRLKNTLEAKTADFIFRFGKKEGSNEFLPVSGNWNGEGADSIGIYEKQTGIFRLKNRVAAGKADTLFKMDFQDLMPFSISVLR